MALLATKPTGKDFPLLDEGTHQVVIESVTNLGLITSTYNGETKTQPKIRIRFVDADGVSAIKRYTLSLHEKATLYKDLKTLLGRDPGESFDVETLVGKQAQIIITHTENQ